MSLAVETILSIDYLKNNIKKNKIAPPTYSGGSYALDGNG